MLRPGSLTKTLACWRAIGKISTRSASSTVEVKEEGDGVATVTLKNAPVNVLDFGTMESYVKEMGALEANKDCRGVIIESACDKAFSAGLDINVFCSGDRQKLKDYWRILQDLWHATYASRLGTVAAVNGAAIAGGCVLAMCCDVRIMANTGPKSVIGLNETKLGISTPFWINDRLVQLVGHHKAEEAILGASLYQAKEAESFGFVDRLVESRQELNEATRREMKRMLEIPDHARARTKLAMRRPLIEKFNRKREANMDELADMILEQKTQAILQAYLKSMSKKKP